MIVISEATPHEPPASASARDVLAMTKAADLVGCRIYFIPPDFSECETAENALWHVPAQETPTLAIWSGFIPRSDRYAAIYRELLRKRIYLPNTPDQHLTAVEFDRAYPRLKGLTPESRILAADEGWENAGQELGYPLFVRGTARSRKAAGWSACVARGPEELGTLVRDLFAMPYRSRGKVIVRTLVPLRHERISEDGFPLGREYRVFLYQDRLLGYGYYWEGGDPLADLSRDEADQMLAVVHEAARRLRVPFIAVDVGQVVSGEWLVIEVGDAQFAGASQTPLLPLWNAMLRIEQSWLPPR